MRILMLLDLPFPTDIRVENEIRTLVEAGHKLAVLSISSDDRPTQQHYSGFQVFRHRVSTGTGNAMRALAATVPLMTHVVAWAATRVHREWPFDAIHAHDLYLAGAARHAAARLKMPFVVDLHEHWAQVIRDYRWSSGFPRRQIVGRRRWVWAQHRWLAHAAAVITVSDVMREAYIGQPLPAEQVYSVPNTVDLRGYGAEEIDGSIADSIQGAPAVMYVGGLVPNRGLDVAIRGMKAIRRTCPQAVLTIVGDGVDRKRLTTLVADLGLSDAVVFTGRVPQDRVPSYIDGADVAINPLMRTGQTDIVLSQKLFQYLLQARPVVHSDCTAMAAVVRSSGGGLVFEAGNVEAFADAVVRLGTQPDLARELGQAGRKAVLERLNWEATAQPLVALYAELSDRAHPASQNEAPR